MRLLIKLLATVFLLSSHLSLAEKPEWAGKGKPSAEQKAAHQAAMEAKLDDDDDDDDDDDKKDKDKKEKVKKNKANKDKEATGLAKQTAKKSEQERKELGKGSEQGQKARQEHSRKWWKFWESDDSEPAQP
jgi:hypothetical protein